MFIKKRYPKILFLIVILLSVVCSILYIKNNKGEKIAKIYKDKKLLYTIDLSSVEKPYEIKLGDDENYNIIQVNHNEISIIEASCHDKVCINTGKINNGTVKHDSDKLAEVLADTIMEKKLLYDKKKIIEYMYLSQRIKDRENAERKLEKEDFKNKE